MAKRRRARCRMGMHLATKDKSDRIFCLKCEAFYGHVKDPDGAFSTKGWGQFTKQRDLYKHTLSSARWKSMRQERIKKTGGSCEKCGSSPDRLELHHLTYIRLGDEKESDVELLCVECHEKCHTVGAREKSRVYDWAEQSLDTYIENRLESGWEYPTEGDRCQFLEWWQNENGVQLWPGEASEIAGVRFSDSWK